MKREITSLELKKLATLEIKDLEKNELVESVMEKNYRGITYYEVEFIDGTSMRRYEEIEYEIAVKETLKRVVKVRANNIENAIEKIKKEYYKEKIILDADDFDKIEFVPV
jgi:hypothetical protein